MIKLDLLLVMPTATSFAVIQLENPGAALEICMAGAARVGCGNQSLLDFLHLDIRMR
jgi:hypothetical protein